MVNDPLRRFRNFAMIVPARNISDFSLVPRQEQKLAASRDLRQAPTATGEIRFGRRGLGLRGTGRAILARGH
jgi:hypothetical protein